MGNDGRRYDKQIWELMAGDTIYREGKWRQAIQYTEMETDTGDTVKKRWELMAGDNIYRDGN